MKVITDIVVMLFSSNKTDEEKDRLFADIEQLEYQVSVGKAVIDLAKAEAEIGTVKVFHSEVPIKLNESMLKSIISKSKRL